MDKSEWIIHGGRSINLSQIVQIEYRDSGELWLYFPRIDDEDRSNLVVLKEAEAPTVIKQLEAAGVVVPPRRLKSDQKIKVIRRKV